MPKSPGRLARRLYQWGARWSGGAFGEAKQEIFHGVDHAAKYRDYPKFREPLRMTLLLVFLLIFIVWIICDLVSNDGFAPGIRDTSYVTTDLVTDLSSVDAKPTGGVCFCPCSFDKDPTLAPQASWDLDEAVKPPAVGAWTCNQSLLPPSDSEGFHYLMDYADFMFLRSLTTPTSEFLLDQQAWAASRYQQMLDASRVQMAILSQDLRIRTDLSDEEKSSIYHSLSFARTGVFATYAYHLGVNNANAVLVTYNERTQAKQRFNCTNVQVPQQTHFRLREWCQPDPEKQPVECMTVHPGANSSLAAAYEAYKRHCNPVMCNCIRHKTMYQSFIAAAAVLGGVYSVCTIGMYLLWLLVRLGMDGEGYESFRRTTMKQQQQQQQQQQQLSIQLSEFPPDPEQPKFFGSAGATCCCPGSTSGGVCCRYSCIASRQVNPGRDSCHLGAGLDSAFELKQQLPAGNASLDFAGTAVSANSGATEYAAASRSMRVAQWQQASQQSTSSIHHQHSEMGQ